MKKILVVLTGGTIGSEIQAHQILPGPVDRVALVERYRASTAARTEVDFTCIRPMNSLSENMTPADWTRLIEAIRARNLAEYSGIIIAHGTDTLAFSAAAVAYCFARCPLPVLLVASDYPLADVRANGLENFICAVDFIVTHPVAGVFVPYRNQHQYMLVHVGTRLASSPQLSGDFFSVRETPYARFVDGDFQIMNPLPEVAEHDIEPVKPVFSERVMLIRPYPGLDYSRLDLKGVDAVLHDLYHSGTACAAPLAGGRYALTDFIDRCRARNIAVFLAPALKSPAHYQSTESLLTKGAEMIWNISLEAAYVKLLLAYGNYDDEARIKAFLARDLAFEHVS